CAYQPPPGVISTTVWSGAMPKKARVPAGWRYWSRARLASLRQSPATAVSSAASAAGVADAVPAAVSAASATGSDIDRARASRPVRRIGRRIMVACSCRNDRASLARCRDPARGVAPSPSSTVQARTRFAGSAPRRVLQAVERAVEGPARAHCLRHLLHVGAVVAADVDRAALHAVELGHDLLLAPGQRARQRRELLLQPGVLILRRQRLRPVQGEVVVAAAVVQAAHLAR